MPNPLDRRAALLALSGLALGVAAAGCRKSSATATPSAAAPAAPDSTPTSPSTSDASAAGQALVAVPADPSFAFTTDVTNRAGSGESAPITAGYWIGRHQVTNARYQEFLAADPSRSAPRHWTGGTYPTGKADHPVLFVSATDATAFCAWLTGRASGWTFRLPTEAEWENAARGPDHLAYPWGDDAGTTYNAGKLTSRYNYNAVVSAYYVANFGSKTAKYVNENSTRYGQSEPLSDILSVSADGGVQGWIDHATWTGFVYTDMFADLSRTGGYTSAVGAYPDGASPYGCLDMAGNAFEWTSSQITATNGAEKGKQVNAVRGGSWYSTGRSCRTSYRGEGRAPEGAYNTVGFRVAAVRS
jgi:formylglycine-generating enzyme required for sulfatase activity